MSDSTSDPAEWAAHLYRHPLGHSSGPPPAMFGDSTIITTISSPTPTVAGPSGSSATPQPSIEGRVGKSSRRRSRASRRAPTTLLNTDTANFRAMVQQFTGIPSGPYTYQPNNSPVINFGVHFNEQQFRQATAVPFGHHQYQIQQFQQQQQQYQAPEQQLFTLGSNSNSNSNNEVFLQGFSGNPRAPMEVSEGFFLDGLSGQVMQRPPNSTNNSNGGYLL